MKYNTRTEVYVSFIYVFIASSYISCSLCIKVDTMEPCYNEDFGTMKMTLLYQVSCHIRVKNTVKE